MADTQREGQWLEKEVTNRLTHLLQATWFVMAGGDRIVATGAGSRPGDILTDARLRQAGVVPDLPHTASLPATRDLGDHPLSMVTWHDDLAIPLAATSSQDLLHLYHCHCHSP